MLPPSSSGKFYQGIFTPTNPSKYIGKQKPVYRSGWELRFFRWVDSNPNVLEWASEAIIVPYISPVDGKAHRYYTDGVVVIKEKDQIVRYIIEIKPSSQLSLPTPTKKHRKTLIYETRMFAINTAKWAAARKWCDQHGFKFLILTEKELGIR